MSDWVPASRRTRLYVWAASVLFGAGMAMGFVSRTPEDGFYVASHALLFVLLVGSWAVTLWSGLRCRNPRLRAGWLLVATGQILSLGTSFVMVAASYVSTHSKFDSAAPLLTVAFLTVGVGLAVGASSIDGVGERRAPLFQAVGLSLFMFVVMLGALIGPGPSMPFALGPRDAPAIMRLALDCGFIFFVGVYATLLQLRLPDGHRARLWMWAAASALVAAMGDVSAPLADLGHGQIYAELMWCLGDVLLAVAASLAADFELARSPIGRSERAEEA